MSVHRLRWFLPAAAAIAAAVGVSGLAAQPGPPRRPPPPPVQPQPLPHHVDDLDQPTLAAAVIEQALTPYLAGVRACYLTNVRTPRAAHMRLEIVIEPHGQVSRVGVVAPEVTRAERARVVACVRREIARWHFPLRGGATWAVIPFYFQRTQWPGAGPMPSCWSPRGCPEPRKEDRS
ncbi:MAG TPA: AgmX/PglI C-terminal domain-containing protein [Kofleriaceae bacterium]|nr:AgmX/PglI C-terminal domain-containing protein [Kofleriaceae bacterium]